MKAETQQRSNTSTDPPRAADGQVPAGTAPAEPSRSLVEGRFYLGLAGLFISLTAMWLTLWVVAPVVAGWSSVVITSGSMAPSIEPGDVVVATPSDGRGLGPGTVVVFRDDARPGLVTHRIVSVNDDGTYETRGDANRVNDSAPLAPDQVVGVAKILVPLVGLPVLWARTGAWLNLGIWAAVITLAALAAQFALIEKYDPWPRSRKIDATDDGSHDVRHPRRQDQATVDAARTGAGRA